MAGSISQDTPQGPIVLIGMMGAGKTTVGQRLADSLGRPFIDIDARVVAMAGRSIAEIFQDDGESAFRSLEQAALHESLRDPRAILATGGGALCRDDAWDALPAGTVVVWLDAPADVLAARVGQGEDRPLLAASPMARLSALLEARQGWYVRAHHRVPTEGRGVDEVTRAVVEAIAWTGADG